MPGRKNNYLEVAQLLVKNGADVDAKLHNVGWTALHWAGLETSALLIQNGANIDARDHVRGLTPLHNACELDELEKVELLIQNGANVNSKLDLDGKTPLHFACEMDHLEVAELLLESSANVNAKPKQLSTPQQKPPGYRVALCAPAPMAGCGIFGRRIHDMS